MGMEMGRSVPKLGNWGNRADLVYIAPAGVKRCRACEHLWGEHEEDGCHFRLRGPVGPGAAVVCGCAVGNR